jgi:carboxymethylenebutenolidase
MTEPAQPDIPAILDAHLESEFARPDVEATMRTMTDDPYLDHVPVMTGGVGRAEVRHFYANHFVGRGRPTRRSCASRARSATRA